MLFIGIILFGMLVGAIIVTLGYDRLKGSKA